MPPELPIDIGNIAANSEKPAKVPTVLGATGESNEPSPTKLSGFGLSI